MKYSSGGAKLGERCIRKKKRKPVTGEELKKLIAHNRVIEKEKKLHE